MENMRKQFLRTKQVAAEMLGRAEKTEVMSYDLQQVEQRVDQVHTSIKVCKNKLCDCLRTKSINENPDKIKKKLDEYPLVNYLLSEVKLIPDPGVLFKVMAQYGQSYDNVLSELIQAEAEIKHKVIERFVRYGEDEDKIKHIKDKLKRFTLDMDSAKTRLAASKDGNPEKVQEELEIARAKVETCKDNLATEIYSVAAKEVEIASMFVVLVQIQMEFYQTALKEMQELLPKLTEEIATCNKRPVFGCPLEDHLRYHESETAFVLEVCCAALFEMGLKDEGLFRIPGNATKIRKLKASFDAGSINFDDFERDPHSVTGTLKLYLRELPDPLMMMNLYHDWMKAVKLSGNERIAEIKSVIQKLPSANYANLRYLVKFLSAVASKSEFNKMTPSNLAICIAPNMMWSPTDDEALMATGHCGTIVECLIVNAQEFFPESISFVTFPAWKFGFSDYDRDRLTPACIANSQGSATNVPRQNPNSAAAASSPGSGNVTSLSRRPKAPAPPPPPSRSDVSTGSSRRHQLKSVINENASESSANLTASMDSDENIDADSFSSSENIDDCSTGSPIAPARHSPRSEAALNSKGAGEAAAKQTAEARWSPGSKGVARQGDEENVSLVLASQTGSLLGHRKTNSLDRTIAQQTTLTTGKASSSKSGALERNLEKHFAHDNADAIRFFEPSNAHANDLSQPIRPPLPAKDDVEKKAVIVKCAKFGNNGDIVLCNTDTSKQKTTAFVSPDSSPDATLESDVSNASNASKSDRSKGSFCSGPETASRENADTILKRPDHREENVPKALLSERAVTRPVIDSSSAAVKFGGEVEPNIIKVNSEPDTPNNVLGGSSSNPSTMTRSFGAPDEASLLTTPSNSVRNRRSMFEVLQQHSPTAPSKLDSVGNSITVVTIHNNPQKDGLCVQEQQPPPRPKPPLPSKPKGGSDLDNDMTRL